MPLRAGDFANLRIYQRYDWGKLARFHVLDDRQYRAYHACTPRARRFQLRAVARLPSAAGPQPQHAGQGAGAMAGARAVLVAARWNILAQQTLMAQNSQLPILREDDGRFWTDGWDGYPMARQQLIDTLHTSRASNPLVLSGDVHSFFAYDLPRNPARRPRRPIPFWPQNFAAPRSPRRRARRLAEQYVSMNHSIKYGRSDKRGYMLLTITPPIPPPISCAGRCPQPRQPHRPRRPIRGAQRPSRCWHQVIVVF
jgi:alkaline phosphatase D